MLAEDKRDGQLEIAHVLCTDIVGYSKLPIDQQSELLRQLNQIVRGTEHFRAAEGAGKLIRLPTGDGMALAFFTSPDAPVRCAIEIGRALKEHPQLQLRMGIDSGPVDRVADVNERSNVAGAGINMAQRVMDCGDVGHILLSKRVAGDLAQYTKWQSQLHDLGEVEVKHGVKVGIVNFVDGEIGNFVVPEKIRRLRRLQRTAVRRKTIAWSLGAISLVVALSLAFWIQSRRAGPSAEAVSVLEKSIAVLPLENLSEDKADAFFADGIQDDVLTSLAKISDLKVISRTSVMQYRGAKRDLREIGRLLGVGNILEGSVRRVGNRVLVNVQLIDATHDRHLWAERYDRTVTDSISLQGELAMEIAHALRARLDPQEKTRVAARPTSNPEAYVLYLQARDQERTARSQEEYIAVDKLYDQIIALDPKFALAMARQSMWNCGMTFIGSFQARKSKAHALAMEALRIAPDLPEAHIALGEWFRLLERNYDAAQKELLIAAQTIPNDPDVIGHLGALYRRQGRWREALAAFHRARELDPRVADDDEAQTTAAVRDWPAAKLLFQHNLEIEPNNETKVTFASVLMNGEGDFAAARALLATIPYPPRDAPVDPSDFGPRWELSMLEGDFDGAEKVMADLGVDELPPPFTGLISFLRACTASARGDERTARELFLKSKSGLESLLPEHGDDSAPLISVHGLIYAYLGEKELAVRESQRAVNLMPGTDAIERPQYLANLALVYAITGERDKAVALVETLLTTPMGAGSGIQPVTLTQLRGWRWESLRSDPRFQKIIEGPEPKTVY